MPKSGSKRKREEVDETQILDVRSVKKLHKLMQQSRDDLEQVPKKPKTEEVKIDDEDFDDGEVWGKKKSQIFYDDTNEYNEEWEKFFHPNTSNDELLHNIDEAKSVVAEELPGYCGSFASDLDDLQSVGDIEDLPEDLQSHIRLLKDVLTHYRSGPLPKTVKMLPHLPGYDNLLEMLSPLDWTVHVYPRMVKVFAAKGGQQAMHFFENYLLPKVRNDISENHRLCVQLFDSLVLSIFRTEEFLSSIFLPWIRAEMTKTEGIILSHLVKKASIKAHFSSVALVLLLEEEFSIPRSMVIESILRKRYILPEKAIACLVKYFVSFADRDCSMHFTAEGRMPVTWFTSFLTFLEFYREGISPDERMELVRVCKHHQHPSITPEIRGFIGLIPTSQKKVQSSS
nr:Bystin [Hymenolepis microstoma]